MPSADLRFNRAVVFIAVLVYWGGVYVQARRVRRRIGRSPNVTPRGTKERLLWTGWVLVVLAWLALPFIVGLDNQSPWLRIVPQLCRPIIRLGGLLLIVAGYAGTLWCYAVMGGTWRMGVNRAEKTSLVTRGPYHLVRHPIYLFQLYMLAGTSLLLPAPVSFVILGIHMLCVLVKATDEEHYLRSVPGPEYDEYLSRTSRFFPKLRSWSDL